ncbi:hypothetical protein DFH27DRAFT_657109 [Peziza echinospora]|nr:hypothetical protein DFH27DRAFT_657109 [Peziza echinospora]
MSPHRYPHPPSDSFHQLLPPNPTPAQYAHDALLTHTHLQSLAHWPNNLHRIACPYPLTTPLHRAHELSQLHAALHPALTALVRRWWSRPDFAEVIPVSEKVEGVLRRLDELRPYAGVGSYRPDFLVPEVEEEEGTRICEINARFVFNGYFLGAMQSEAMARLGLGGGAERAGEGMASLLAAHRTLFDPDKPVAFVTHREQLEKKFLDIAMARSVYPSARMVPPSALRLTTSGTTTTLTDDVGPLEQFVLELHQAELEELSAEVLLALGRACHNDLRTIYFVHDKRMLGLLRRELDWLVGLGEISPAQAGVLRRGVLETYAPGDEMFRALAMGGGEDNYKAGWVLKKCMSGKGDGMVFGKDVDAATWRALLEEQVLLHRRRRQSRSRSRAATPRSDSDASTSEEEDIDGGDGGDDAMAPYVLQRYFKQRRVPLVVHTRNDGADIVPADVKTVEWYIVGSMLCINDIYLGCPFYRTNANDIIAVGTGGVSLPSVILPPPATSCTTTTTTLPIPMAIDIPSPSIHTNHPALIAASLKSHGIALLSLAFPDPASDYISSLLPALGLGEALTHSSTHGILWDVRPTTTTTTSSSARSHTPSPFPWHTDCSYEAHPPRFFALHVLHADRHGGGILRLLRTESIVARLPREVVETLQTPCFRFTVPPEFCKGAEGEGGVVGAVLSRTEAGEWKIRFRADIVEGVGAEAGAAVEALRGVLLGGAEEEESSPAEQGVLCLSAATLKDGTIVLLDNARWMHARSAVRDPERWLRRVRFGAEKF